MKKALIAVNWSNPKVSEITSLMIINVAIVTRNMFNIIAPGLNSLK